MESRLTFSSGTRWENEFCYSRGVRVGNMIYISGTTSVRDGEIISEGNVAGQARECFKIIEECLRKLGASLTDVVRTRMYVKDITHSKDVGLIHAEVFKGINPAATMIEVNRLINEKLLIEIEVDAMLIDKH